MRCGLKNLHHYATPMEKKYLQFNLVKNYVYSLERQYKMFFSRKSVFHFQFFKARFHFYLYFPRSFAPGKNYYFPLAKTPGRKVYPRPPPVWRGGGSGHPPPLLAFLENPGCALQTQYGTSQWMISYSPPLRSRSAVYEDRQVRDTF